MNRSLHLTLSAVVLLTAVMACALPGQTVQPAPTMDPLAIEAAVAGTAQAAATQTAQANPIPPTETMVPTATMTPTPRISLQGTSLVIQEDQSTLFIDHKLGFQLIVPAGWLTTRINEEEYLKAFTLDVVVANPTIGDRLRRMQSNSPEYFRLDAIDLRSGHIMNGLVSGINVVHQPPEYAKTLEECLKLEKEFVRTSTVVGHKILSSGYQQTPSGMKVLVMEESWTAASDQNAKIFRKLVFFSVPSGIVNLDLQVDFGLKDVVLPDFEQVVNSFTLLNP